MWRRLSVVLLAFSALCGCAGMKVHDDDSFPTAAGKVILRVPLAVATVGISEIAIDGNADKAATADYGRYLAGEVEAGRMSSDQAAQAYGFRVSQLNQAEATRAVLIGAILGAASQPAPTRTYNCWQTGPQTFNCQ
jgi:hypothetical protein